MAKSRSGHWDGSFYTEIYQTSSNGTYIKDERPGTSWVNSGWTFLSSVVDYQQKRLLFYINGEQVGSAGLIDFDFSSISSLSVSIANEQMEDELTIYDRALSQSEVMDLYNSYFGNTPSNPVPEPATIMLIGFGLLWIAGIKRKHRLLERKGALE